jgi:hypothetical protein
VKLTGLYTHTLKKIVQAGFANEPFEMLDIFPGPDLSDIAGRRAIMELGDMGLLKDIDLPEVHHYRKMTSEGLRVVKCQA